jgi:transposase
MAAAAHKLFVGIDVAATSATVAWLTPGGAVSRPVTIDQTPAGYAKLQQQLTTLGYQPSEILVVMEATGSYWISLATALVEAGFAVSVINPKQAVNYREELVHGSFW